MGIRENIKRAREQMALSQAGLAKLIGSTEEHIRELEADADDMRVSELCRIAEATHVSPAWLLSGDDDTAQNRGYDAVLRIYNRQDRATVTGILVMNGYDVGQHKAERTRTGKTVDYFIHAKLVESNAETSR